MKRVLITTLGCKVNQADSEELAHRYERDGYKLVREGEPADICIVNTCTVTAKADRQCRNMIRRLRGKYPKAKMVVTGCYANVAGEELEKMEGLVILREQSDRRIQGDQVASRDPSPRVAGLRMTMTRTRPMLKVQDGCDRFCTYCIVPYARGRSRSVPVDEVARRVKELADAGNREIVLTGIHLGAYGKDMEPQTSLVELLKKIVPSPCPSPSRGEGANYRLRLSSIDPDEWTDETVLSFKFQVSNGSLCPHFHIPLQSGSDETLKKMGRRYTAGEYRSLISNLRSQIVDCAIGADVIVGFPGETKEIFEETKDFIESLPIDYLHVFPYSRRKLTAASKLKETVTNAEKQRRVKVLMEISNKKRMAFYKSFVGKQLNVVIEYKRNSSTGLLKGVSENYIPVLIDGGDELMGQLVKVKVAMVSNDKTMGTSLPQIDFWRGLEGKNGQKRQPSLVGSGFAGETSPKGGG